MARPHPSLIDLASGRTRPGTAISADAYNSAGEHRVSGLVHHGIATGDLVAGDTLRKASAEARLTMRARNLRLWDDYEEVRDRLQAIGIEIAVIKGIAFDLLFYPAQATRPAADLDIVIDPAAASRISEVVAAVDPGHGLIGEMDDLVARGLLQSVDVRLPSRTWLDIHVDPIKTGVELRSHGAMWERTIVRETADGRSLRTLEPADALVQAVVHQLKDRFSLLRGHADIARIVQSGDVDWDVVAATLRAEGLAGLFWPALSIVLDELNVHSMVAPNAGLGTASVERVWPRATRLRGHEGMQQKVRAKHAIPFLMRGRRREALRHYLRVLFPPRALLAHQHPGYRGPYLWRLLRMRMRFASVRHRRNKRTRNLELQRPR